MFGIAVRHSRESSSVRGPSFGPGQPLLSATLDQPQRTVLHVDRVMLVRLVVIRPGENHENVAWSGEHHRPSVAGCTVCDWLGQLNQVEYIELDSG
jgi:hypothetical protein